MERQNKRDRAFRARAEPTTHEPLVPELSPTVPIPGMFCIDMANRVVLRCCLPSCGVVRGGQGTIPGQGTFLRCAI
jgi:hypothetical protein